jgi:hypothetical protein
MPVDQFAEKNSSRIPSSFYQHPPNSKTDCINKIARVLSSYPSRPALAAAVLSNQHIYSSSSHARFSRTLLWKTALLQIDTIRSGQNENIPHLDLSSLREHRKTYTKLSTNIGIPWHLLSKESRYYKPIKENEIIDNNLEEDLVNLTVDIDTSTQINKNKNKVIIHKQKVKFEPVDESNDPLSGDKSKISLQPNTKYESDLDVLTMIIADVERLFPEHPEMFINSEKDKLTIIEILYRYSKWINELREKDGKKKIGYVQGMHELCGVIYAVLKVELVDDEASNNQKESKDGGVALNGEDISELNHFTDKKKLKEVENETSKVNEKLSLQIEEFISSKYFAHDVFSMFQQLMAPIIDKYFTSSGIIRESIIFDLKLHHIDPGNLKQPGLATALKDSNIESQLWLTRWFRMILTREVGLAYSVRVWDGLIAYACVGAMADTATNGHDISVLLPYVVILLILRIRSVLLKSLVPSLRSVFGNHDDDDDTETLSLLLHYPSSSSTSISRSVSFESEYENDNEPIMVYRKTRDPHKPLLNVARISKMPSAVDLFSDAAHICGLSDAELNEIGPSLIAKYSNGDIYDVLKTVEKNKSSTPFFDGMLKKTKSWRISSASNIENSRTVATTDKTGKNNELLPSIDSNRSRLEMKLQKRVQDRLRDRSNA